MAYKDPKKAKLHSKAYYQLHRDEFRIRAKKFRKNNREKWLKTKKRFRDRHREDLREKQRVYRTAHFDQINTRRKTKHAREVEKARWQRYKSTHKEELRLLQRKNTEALGDAQVAGYLRLSVKDLRATQEGRDLLEAKRLLVKCLRARKEYDK